MSSALVALACGAGGSGRPAARDSTARSAPATRDTGRPEASRDTVRAYPVNTGTQGMRFTVRWVLSPDRRALVVVEDAVSVEAEALPDGFLYASEATGAIVQVDNVWDVAPAPDWTRLAFSRAHVLRAGERDTMPETEWRRVESQLPEDVTERDPRSLRRLLEAHAFPASGMSLMLGLGLAQVLRVDGLAPGRVPAPRGPTHSLNGWRVRWTAGGDMLGVGAAPRTVQDDAPPTHWTLVRARPWATYNDTLGATTDSTRFARLRWVEGPTTELASPVNLASGAPLAIDGGTIGVAGGMIRVTTRGRDGRPRVRVIGPGRPLVATASGRFIAALVERRDAGPHEMRAATLVYDVPPE